MASLTSPLVSALPEVRQRDGTVQEEQVMDDEAMILLPAELVSVAKGDPQVVAEASHRLKGVPRFFYSLDELQDIPFPPPEDKNQECLNTIANACGLLAVLALLGTISCIVILIFNEAIPHACPAHHVSCGELEWTSNPHFRTVVLLFFLSFTIALSATFAACQSNCVCLSAFLEEDGIWLRWKKHMVAFLRRCRQAPSECSRRLYCCCRRSRLRVQPQESRTSLEARGFGASEDFKDLMIIPVPAPLPQKPSIPGFPRRWCHTALPKFHEVVELSTEGEGADVARLILSDPTWHCPPRCERVFRIESSDTWKTYVQMRTAELRKAQHGVPTVKKEEVLGEELEERVNEKILFYGTTVDMAMCVKVDAQVPDTPDCPRHVLLRRLGGGAQFCDRGFLAHEQATEAGYNKENLDSPWAVLVCRVVLGRSLVHNGQHGGPRLQREWGSGRYGSIMIQRDGHREFLLPPDVRHAAYPEYVVILR